MQRARQDLQLAPEDVAQILHLSVKHIVALEQDDYKRLPGPTYVRGYLRSYAQLLGLAPEKLIESYSALITPPKPLLSLPLSLSVPLPQISSSDRLTKLATVAVAAMVLGAVFLWWRSAGEAVDPERAPSALARVSAAGSAGKTSSSENLPVSLSNNATTPANDAGPDLAPAPNSSTAQPADAKTPGTKQMNSQVTVSGMILNISPTEPAKVIGPAATTHTDRAIMGARRSVEIPPGAKRSRLVLRAQQESWADIRDVHDNKLLYENVPAGRSIAIEGVAPFNIFLGNADGVQVEFNGKKYNVSQHKRGQVARFTLDEAVPENN